MLFGPYCLLKFGYSCYQIIKIWQNTYHFLAVTFLAIYCQNMSSRWEDALCRAYIIRSVILSMRKWSQASSVLCVCVAADPQPSMAQKLKASLAGKPPFIPISNVTKRSFQHSPDMPDAGLSTGSIPDLNKATAAGSVYLPPSVYHTISKAYMYNV